MFAPANIPDDLPQLSDFSLVSALKILDEIQELVVLKVDDCVFLILFLLQISQICVFLQIFIQFFVNFLDDAAVEACLFGAELLGEVLLKSARELCLKQRVVELNLVLRLLFADARKL